MIIKFIGDRDCFKLIVPSLLAVVLFVASVFGLILPGFKASLLDRKKETIKELTTTAWNILDYYNQKELQISKMPYLR